MTKRYSLEDVARGEAKEAEERDALKQAWAELQARQEKEVPECFFRLCEEIRGAIGRFNDAGDPARRFTFAETPAIALKEVGRHRELRTTFARGDVHFEMMLLPMSRAGKPDVYIIEGSLKIGTASHIFRVEGTVTKDRKTAFRVTVDLKRIPLGVDQLAERMVLAAAKRDLDQLVKDL